jgi:hypothetical protein
MLALLVLRSASAADAPPAPPRSEAEPAPAAKPETAEMTVETARQRVQEAEAKVAAKDYEAAADLYSDAYRALASDRVFLTDYAHCAFLAKRLTGAESLLREALEGADAAFLSSPKGKRATELLPKVRAAIERAAAERLRTVGSLVDELIRGLARHADLAKLEWVRTKRNDFTPSEKYASLPLSALVVVLKDGKHVAVIVTETWLERSVAEGRRDAILATIRGQKRAWERAFVLRSNTEKPELHEVNDERLVEEEGRTERHPRTTFCWNPGSAASAKRTSVAIVELVPPSEDPSRKAKRAYWQVTIELDSTSLK